MPVLTRTLCAAAIAFAIAAPAFAQQGDSWDMQEGKAYVVDMQGKMKMMQPKDPGMAMMKKRGKPVPKGMVFFMSNGQLYMMQGNRSLFETNF
jgi:Flp pilus assembly protein TadD